jgi:hypothetical protein
VLGKNLVGPVVPCDTVVPMIFHKFIKTTTTSVQVSSHHQNEHKSKVCPSNSSLTSCLSLLNKRKMFA